MAKSKKVTVKVPKFPGLDSLATRTAFNLSFGYLTDAQLDLIAMQLEELSIATTGSLRANYKKLKEFFDTAIKVKLTSNLPISTTLPEVKIKATAPITKKRTKKEVVKKEAAFKVAEKPGVGSSPGAKFSLTATSEDSQTISNISSFDLEKESEKDLSFKNLYEKLGNEELLKFCSLKNKDDLKQGYLKTVKLTDGKSGDSRNVVIIGTALVNYKNNLYNLFCTIDGKKLSDMPWDAMLTNTQDKPCRYSKKVAGKINEEYYIRLYPYKENTKIYFSLYPAISGSDLPTFRIEYTLKNGNIELSKKRANARAK